MASLRGTAPAPQAGGAPLDITLRCSFCRGRLETREAVYCAACLAPHHADCHATHGRCAAPGCGVDQVVRPSSSAAREAPTPMPLRAGGDKASPEKEPPRRRRYAAAVAGVLALLGLVSFLLAVADPSPGPQEMVVYSDSPHARLVPPPPAASAPEPILVRRVHTTLVLSTRAFRYPVRVEDGERLEVAPDADGYTAVRHHPAAGSFRRPSVVMVAQPGDTLYLLTPTSREAVTLRAGEKLVLTSREDGSIESRLTRTSL